MLRVVVFVLLPIFIADDATLRLPRSTRVLSGINKPAFATSFELIENLVPETGMIVRPIGFSPADGDFPFTPEKILSLRQSHTVLADFTNIGSDIVRYLRDSDVIKVLDLSGTNITDADVETLTSHASLEVHDLSDTNITGKALASLLKLKQLKVLSISGTNLSDEDIEKYLSASKVEALFCHSLRGKRRSISVQSDSLRVLDFSFNEGLRVHLQNMPNGESLFLADFDFSRISFDESRISKSLCFYRVGNSNEEKGRLIQRTRTEYLRLSHDWFPAS